jgi:hypothetical protein
VRESRVREKLARYITRSTHEPYTQKRLFRPLARHVALALALKSVKA